MADELPPQSTPGYNAPLSPYGEPSSTGLAPNVAAGLSVIMTFITGIIFFLIEKRSAFVRFWAMQAIVLGAAWFIFGIISTILSMILGKILGLLAVLWGLVSLVISLGFLVLWIICLVQAFSGKEWEIPVLGKIARQNAGTLPPAAPL